MKKALLSLLLAIACVPMAFGQRPANVVTQTTDTTVCGQFRWINNMVYTTDTIVTHISGDTVYVLDLTMLDPSVDTVNAIPLSGACSVEWNGKSWTIAGTFLDTIRSEMAGQCDSVIKIEITLAGTETIEALEATECDYYATSWGDTIRTSVTATDTAIIVPGCSLTIGSLNITINASVTADTTEMAVDGCSLEWNGMTISEANTVYSHTFTAANGCDSTVSLKVTSFSGELRDTTDLVVCDRYIFDGDTITTDSLITTVDNSGDCLVYNTLRLTIAQSYRDTAAVTVRDTIGGCNMVWFGNTYGTEDLNRPIYANASTVAAGCDSLVAIRITSFSGIHHDTTAIDYCGRYIWTHGNYRDTIETDGEYLDSTITATCRTYTHLMLTFNDKYDTITPDSVCARYVYTFPSRAGIAGREDTARFYESGFYTVDENGVELYSVDFASKCKTHHAIELKIKQPEQRESGVDIDTVVCDEFRFTFNNVTHIWRESADSNLVASRTTMRSCYDLHGHVKLTVNYKEYDTVKVNACDYYTWEGYTDETYTYSTTAEVTLPDTTTADGCNIIGFLDLTINNTPTVTIEGDRDLVRDSANQTLLKAVCDDEAATFVWYRSQGNGEVEVSTSNEYLADNIYDNVDIHLKTTSQNGCIAHNWITITYNVGIDESENIHVNIYPNPASRYLNIESNDGLRGIAIFNTIGQQVINSNVDGNSTKLDLGGLASGTYTMLITLQNGEQATRKFIVNK